MINNKINQLVDEYYEKWVNIRRHLHKYPELSFKEFKTQKYIENILKPYDIIKDTTLSGTALSFTLNGYEYGKTIAIRADMDALPIEEKTNLPFSSANKGIMHACGHDAHITMVIGTLMILYEMRNTIKGQIKFIFQPAEETEGGAKTMVEEGVLKNPKVEAIIGGHVWPELPVGTIGIKSGAVMSSPDIFDIKINGTGGHVGKPHLTVDPIMVGAEIITSLQNSVSKTTNPFEPSVISITSIHSGDAYNVTPEICHLKGTVRTYDNSLRNEIKHKIEKSISGICKTYGSSYEFKYHRRFPPTLNDESLYIKVKKSAEEILGKENVLKVKYPSMSSEDFSYFSEKIPGTYIYIGSRNEEKNLTQELHSPSFTIDENLLKTGVKVYVKSILDFLNQ